MAPDLMRATGGTDAMVIGDTESGTVVPRVWVVRADGGKYADHFVTGGYVAVGWFDLSSVDTHDQLREIYELKYPDAPAGQVANEIGQLAAFRLEMGEGDYLITPAASRESLRYGRIVGPCVAFKGDDGCRYLNRRAVAWAEALLSRSSLGESFQRTLGSPRTVFRVSHPEEFMAAIGAHDSPIADSSADLVEVEPDSGIELEQEDPQQSATEQPFDSSKIKVRTVNVVVDQVVSRIRYGEIDLQPDFQRVRGIWDVKRKSRLIESLLLRIPIPVFYVAADHDEQWKVVDGVQRISTIYGYMEGEFTLAQMEYRREFGGKRYGELPRPMQRRISETQLVVNVIEPGTPPEVMFNIFRRINTGGMTLNGQEIRHALNPGLVRNYLKALAESEAFLDATDRSIKPHRMTDRECVLRFLAFYIEPWERYTTGSLENQLERAMKTINDMASEQVDAVAGAFEKAMRAATRIFENDAFRKRYRPDDGRHQISLALFEAWAVQLARCSPQEIDRLVAGRAEVRKRFMALLNGDTDFEKAISVSTGTPLRIRKRFTAIRDLVEEFL